MSLRLYANNGSPFALKAIILSRELALFPRITIDYSVAPSPIALTTSHSNQVPHGKIPALIVDEKSALFGSEVICAYFLEIAEKKPAAPGSMIEKYERLTTESIASEIMTAALAIRYERIGRPEDLQWPSWIAGQMSKIHRLIPALWARGLPDPKVEILGVEGVAAAVALWYIDKRAPDSNWRELDGGKELEAWYIKIQERSSWKENTFGLQ